MFDFLDDLIDSPVRTAVRIATQPARDAVDVLEGLSEGEIRAKAALSLGADVVAGMALGEVIEVVRAG